ncbi:DegT/DnrJ/EryC1/StrS family aminotransferase [Vibrio cholerae]|nr:DegT/DnrJ/EryC1/StrS family aminotransferase [Vibrio cholerae]
MLRLYNAAASKEITQVIGELCTSGQIASGEFEFKLKKKISSVLGAKNVSVLSNYYSCIDVLLKIIGINKGDKVICKSFSCLNTTSPVLNNGAEIVWVDLKPNSTDISLEDLENKIIKNRPKVLINYHISGYVDNTESIKAICEKYNVIVVEDSNALLFSSVNDNYLCNISNYTVYSLYPNRLVGGIDGGILVCRSELDTKRVDALKRLGIPSHGFRDELGEINPLCDIELAGVNAVNSNISNAMAYESLKLVDGKLDKLTKNVALLRSLLKDNVYVDLVDDYNYSNSSICWNFLILVNASSKIEFISKLRKSGVEASTMHINNHYYSLFPEGDGLENTDNFYKRVLAIPCGWWLNPEEIRFVAKKVNEISQQLGG